jgi:hypothetical protein
MSLSSRLKTNLKAELPSVNDIASKQRANIPPTVSQRMRYATIEHHDGDAKTAENNIVKNNNHMKKYPNEVITYTGAPTKKKDRNLYANTDPLKSNQKGSGIKKRYTRVISQATYKQYLKKYKLKLTVVVNNVRRYKTIPEMKLELYQYEMNTHNPLKDGLFFID